MIPEISPPRWAKFAIFPKPNRSKNPVKPINSQINMNKYIAGGNEYLLILENVSWTKQNPNSPYTTPDRPPNIDGPEKAYWA